MIVVKIELHSAQDKSISDRGTLIIDNIGGTDTKRNYRCRMFQAGAAERWGIKSLILGPQPIREAFVNDHSSKSQPIQSLVAKALKALDY